MKTNKSKGNRALTSKFEERERGKGGRKGEKEEKEKKEGREGLAQHTGWPVSSIILYHKDVICKWSLRLEVMTSCVTTGSWISRRTEL